MIYDKNVGFEILLYVENMKAIEKELFFQKVSLHTGLHKLCHPTIWDESTWSKFGACGEHGDVFLFSNLGAL